MGDSTIGTLRHIDAVREIGVVIIDKLLGRLNDHDKSKLEEPELAFLNEHVKPPDGYATQGGVKLVSANLNKFLKHHYAVNRHHPEHHENGVDGMTLIDLMEMLIDWQASTLRTNDGDIYRSIQWNKSRFKISPQLTRVLMNTALEFDQLTAHLREGYSEDVLPKTLGEVGLDDIRE